jgi:hypothetical protein
MSNKHFCQGPYCHTRPTSDRFLKSKGIIRGRYARLNKDHEATYYPEDKYFCSLGCSKDWLGDNMTLIEMGIPVPFIRERRFTEGYEKITTTQEGWNGQSYNSNSIKKIETQNS